jgi:ribosomal protein L11 methylase PrmA
MATEDAQWLVVTYTIDAGLSDVVTNLLNEIDFHDFTISSRVDKQLDLMCYGRDGVLAEAVRDRLSHLTIADEHIVAQNDLIASADDRKAVEICRGVLLIPEDAHPFEPPEIPLYLGRGPAFGDGRHPTTRSVARLMRDLPWEQQLVWDVGAGSGVLGLLAKALGANEVLFGDIDEDAVRTCQRSCELNGYDGAQVFTCDLLKGFPAAPLPDTIIANIYAELVTELLESAELINVLPTGRLILSGISHHKVDAVRACLGEHGFAIQAEEQEEWWHAIHATR